MKGFFIGLCGLDGAGKTTQSQLLKEYIEKKWQTEVILVHGFKPSIHISNLKHNSKLLGSDMNGLFTPEICSLSFVADLWEKAKAIIIPALSQGKCVITDKYIMETLVYSRVYGSDTLLIEQMLKLLPMPDIYFLLDISPEEASQRIAKRHVLTKKAIGIKENIPTMQKARPIFLENLPRTTNGKLVDGEDATYKIHEKLVYDIEQRKGSIDY